jgi:hypothetical protein
VDGQRKALIVASDKYEHDGLRRLQAPAADAEALGGVLGDPQIGDFAVQLVHNEPAHLIQAQIEEFLCESRPEDVLLVHFSCHGLKSDSGELFFAARNTRPNRLGSTAVSADFVQRCMRASRSRTIVLLLDCCYGGAFAQGVTVRAAGDVNVLDAFPGGKLGGGRGRAVITASSAMEYAFEGDNLADDHSPQPSVFTAALVKGLASGDADRDEDGWISLNELYDYIFDQVRERNPHQTPGRDVEMQGELYLARSRRRRIRAAPVPLDLDAARQDPNMFTRLGAVTELRARLVSDNLPAAAGALAILGELAETDIQFVADAAKAALREAEVHPDETELHFGQLEQGSPSPHRTVRLLGPAVARACTPDTSNEWIHVKETSEGFDVSIGTAQAGMLRGSLTVKGPTGEAVIAVDVDLIPPPPKTPAQPTGAPANDKISEPEPGPRGAHQTPPPAPPVPEQLPALPAAPATPPAQPGNAAAAAATQRARRVPEPSAPPSAGSARTIFWALMPTLSLSLLILVPIPFIQAATRLRDPKLRMIAVAYPIAWVAVLVISIVTKFAAGSLFVLLTAFATVHTFRLRRRVFPRPSVPADQIQGSTDVPR